MAKVAAEEIRLSNAAALPLDGEPSAVTTLRERAATRFHELGLPTPRLEAWKYTNLAPVAKHDFRLASAADEAMALTSFEGIALAEVTISNGYVVSIPSTLAEGLRITRLSDALRRDEIARHFGRHADVDGDAMIALNTALFQDGIVIEADRPLEGFVHLRFVSSGDPAMSMPRVLVVANRAAALTVVETYSGTGTYFVNSVTEIVAEEGSAVEHIQLSCESAEAYHVGTVRIHQGRSANVISRTMSLGGQLVRNNLNAVLGGEGATLALEGLYVGTGTQHIDNHTVIDHAHPHCESVETFKGVLDQNARGIFDGTIIVRPGAQKTVSKQVNKNLLLSETAIADSKPTLEIYNDDVKCNHGSTIGQLEEEPMFYLRSRGIGEEDARNLLVYAFAGEVVDRIRIEPVREQIRRVLFQSLPERLPERRGGAR